MLCTVCEELAYDDLVLEYDGKGFPEYPHHRNYAELQACSHCEFCLNLTLNISSDEQLQLDSSWQGQQIYLRIFPSSTATEESKSNLLVYCHPGGGNGIDRNLITYGLFVDRTRFEFDRSKPDPQLPVNAVIGGRPISAHSGSDECLHMASCWLKQCVNDHKNDIDLGPTFLDPREALESNMSRLEATINQVPKQRFRPSRTINVGPLDGSQDPYLECHTDKALDVPMLWATLSWNWGESTPLTTTLSTLGERQNCLPLTMMPPTFRDAVLITRKLGFPHLWIDALCIIQDSREDWEFEAARMGDVYRHGILNIAVDRSSTCYGGIFSYRTNSRAPAKLPLRSQKLGIESYMYVRPGRWDICQRGIGNSQSALSSRGWVLQESLLSPRTLHYACDQLLWECSHYTFCECSIFPIVAFNRDESVIRARWVSNKMILPNDIKSLDQATDEQYLKRRASLYDFWLQIVSNYSARKLTDRTDILPALAGAASIFQSHLGDRYLAGIFEGDLLRGLLWRLETPLKSIIPALSSYPSWSWASITGKVTPEIGGNSTLVVPALVNGLEAQIVSAETYLGNGQPVPTNDFLHISMGKITLKGYVLRGNSLANLRYPSKRVDFFKENSTEANSLYGYRNSIHLDVIENAQPPQDVVLLHVGRWEWKFAPHVRSSTRVETRFAGMILREADPNRSFYHRVGTAVMDIRFFENKIIFRLQNEVENLIATGWELAVVTIV